MCNPNQMTVRLCILIFLLLSLYSTTFIVSILPLITSGTLRNRKFIMLLLLANTNSPKYTDEGDVHENTRTRNGVGSLPLPCSCKIKTSFNISFNLLILVSAIELRVVSQETSLLRILSNIIPMNGTSLYECYGYCGGRVVADETYRRLERGYR